MSAAGTHYDVVVVGAGVAGLQAAHTFLALDPSLSLLVIDSKATVGGTWAKEHIYHNLRSNNLQGYLEYTDFSILDADVGVEPRGLIQGSAVHEYFERFVDKFDLRSRIRLKTKVIKATNNAKNDVKAWKIELSESNGDKLNLSTITCSKLLVCTGQTSQPKNPNHRGAESFEKPIVHSQNIAAHDEALRTNPAVKHITIIGGGKSAHDAVYNFSTAGKKVTWLLRKSKTGAKVYMVPSYPAVGPFNPWIEGLLMLRPLSWMGAAPWSCDGFGWVRSFLHGTAIGRFIVRTYFGSMSTDTIRQNGLPRLGSASDALTPPATLQWYAGNTGILHYPKDFYQTLLDNKVEIIQEELDHLESGTIVFADGREIRTDAIVNCTGYYFGPSFPLYPVENQLSWGMPISPEHDNLYPSLDRQADEELLQRFPELHNSPAVPDKTASLTPWRLWRFIAPPSQAAHRSGPRNLAFLTNIETFQTFLKTELVALWTYAYLTDQLEVEPGKDAYYEAALYSRWGWWQKPYGKQGKSGDCFHEGIAFYDRLLCDLGLRRWRKGWGVLGEVFGGYYTPSNYKGIKEEWVAKRRSLRGK